MIKTKTQGRLTATGYLERPASALHQIEVPFPSYGSICGPDFQRFLTDSGRG